MAEKKAAGKDEQGEAAGEGSNRKKRILLAGGGAVLVLVLGIVLSWLLLGGKDDEETADDDAEHEVVAAPAHYVALGDKFTIVLSGEGKPHYLVVAVSVLTRDAALVDEIKFNMPLLRDRLGSLFASQSFDTLRTDEGRVALRAETLKTVQELVTAASAESADAAHEEEEDTPKKGAKDKKKGEKKPVEEAAPRGIEQVFFTEFVLQ